MGMDRVIEKKKWTTAKILQIAAIALFAFFTLLIIFQGQKQQVVC